MSFHSQELKFVIAKVKICYRVAGSWMMNKIRDTCFENKSAMDRFPNPDTTAMKKKDSWKLSVYWIAGNFRHITVPLPDSRVILLNECFSDENRPCPQHSRCLSKTTNSASMTPPCSQLATYMKFIPLSATWWYARQHTALPFAERVESISVHVKKLVRTS